MKNRILLLVLIGSLAINAGFAVMLGLNFLSRPTEGEAKPCPFTAQDTHLYTFLGLTDEQLKKIEPLAQDFHRQMDAVGSKILNSRSKLVDAMAQEQPDMAAIDEIHKNIFSNQSAMQSIVLAHIMDMKNVLNREQQDKFFQSMRLNFARQSFPMHQ